MIDARVGFVTQAGMGALDAIEAAGRIGLDQVELLMHGDTDREYLAANEAEITAALADHDLDLTVHCPFYSVDIGAAEPHVRAGSVEELTAAFETAAALGAERGVVHPSSGARPRRYDDATVREWVLESIRELVEHAAPLDFEVCVENLFNGRFTFREFDRVFEATDASMTLDTGHAHISGADAAELTGFVETHADRIGHIHLNDSRSRSRDEHVPVGAGDVDFEALLDALAAADWTGTCSIEVITANYEYIAASKAHLDRVWPTAG